MCHYATTDPMGSRYPPVAEITTPGIIRDSLEDGRFIGCDNVDVIHPQYVGLVEPEQISAILLSTPPRSISDSLGGG